MTNVQKSVSIAKKIIKIMCISQKSITFAPCFNNKKKLKSKVMTTLYATFFYFFFYFYFGNEVKREVVYAL